MNELVWIDLETTGLEPKHCCILEMAMVLTDSDLNVLEEFSRVIKQPKRSAVGFRSAMPAEVLAMHASSGLLDDVAAATYAVGAVESEMRVLMELTFGPAHANIRKRPLIGGSSVHFDRAFIEVHMPQLNKHFHYRHFDVTSISEAARRWYPDQFRDRRFALEVAERSPVGAGRDQHI